MRYYAAFFGAALNILLNLLLIPTYSAMGATVATFVSYFAVFIIRLITTGRILPFKQEWPRWSINTALALLLSGAVTLANGDHGAVMWGLACVLFVLIAAFNAKAVIELLRDGRRMLKGR